MSEDLTLDFQVGLSLTIVRGVVSIDDTADVEARMGCPVRLFPCPAKVPPGVRFAADFKKAVKGQFFVVVVGPLTGARFFWERSGLVDLG